MARIRQMFQVSTAHITQQDDEILLEMFDGEAAGLHVMYTGHGYIIWRSLGRDPSVPTDDCEDLGLSASFRKVLEAARDAGCDFINIDCDEPAEGEHDYAVKCPQLDKHDW